MMPNLVRLIWSEPAAPHPSGPGARDWTLMGVLVALCLIEAIVRPELSWTSVPLIVCFAMTPTILWRRTRPLAMVAIAFGATGAISLAELVSGTGITSPHTMAFAIVLPYALFRWGAGRDVVIGLSFIGVSASLGLTADGVTPLEFVGGFAVLLAPMGFGAAARYRERARVQELEQVKSREREQFARDLHDTVAHHVSAIAIRAQAGQATASVDPTAAVEALRVIETEASRTLGEMRAMVRFLRRDEAAELAPNPTIADIAQLADSPSDGPPVEIQLSGDVSEVSASVSTAVYRLAQESITNARRHARQATRIAVAVTADDDSVQMRVSDDGALVDARPSFGYGLIGMTERAELLGGRCDAGPNPERGWTVTAVLPRKGPTV